MEEMGGELYLLLQSPYEFVFARYTPSTGQLTPLPLPHGMKGMDSLSTHGDHIYISAFNSQEYRILEYSAASHSFTNSWPSVGYVLSDNPLEQNGNLVFAPFDRGNNAQLQRYPDGTILQSTIFDSYQDYGIFTCENNVLVLLAFNQEGLPVVDIYKMGKLPEESPIFKGRYMDTITEGKNYGNHFFGFGNPANELRPPEEAKNGMVIQRFNPETMEKTGEAVVSGSNMVGINFFKDNYLWIPMGSNSVPGLVRIDPDTLDQKVFKSPELPYGK